MDFIDLKTQQQRIIASLEAKIKRVLDHGNYIMGPEIAELESRLAAYTAAKHAISCASGTDALLMALMACGIGPGDAVFTTPFTFIATAEVISLLGATPVFVDIDRDTYNIDPTELERALEGLLNPAIKYPLPRSVPAISLKPKAVIAVDLFGLPADYDRLTGIAKKYHLVTIEDAAQSFGAEYKGKRACTFGDIACTSFFPAKPLGCYGDGGMCFCNDDQVADVMRSIRVHGKGSDKYDNIRIGINGRLDTLQAAILLSKFDIFPEEVELREQAAGRYTALLRESPLIVPNIPAGYKSVWAQYSLLAADEMHRARYMESLQKAGIPTAIYYPKPLHLQGAFSELGYGPGDFPVSEDCSRRIFSIPMHPYLTQGEQHDLVTTLRNAAAI